MASSKTVEAAAEWVDIDALKPWKNNPRINDKAVPHIAASIKRFGFASPIIARRADGEVIAGHTRLKAAQTLGLKQVPVRFLDLDPADAHLLAVADNKTAELADWDKELLGAVLSDLHARDLDMLDGTGLTESAIDKLIDETHGIEEDLETEEDKLRDATPDKRSYVLVFGGWKIPVTEDESDALEQLLTAYEVDHGKLDGVAGRLIEALRS